MEIINTMLTVFLIGPVKPDTAGLLRCW